MDSTSTAGLYENRIYVSPVNGDDANDGKTNQLEPLREQHS